MPPPGARGRCPRAPVDVVVGRCTEPGMSPSPTVALAHVEDLQLAGTLAQLGHVDALDPLDRRAAPRASWSCRRARKPASRVIRPTPRARPRAGRPRRRGRRARRPGPARPATPASSRSPRAGAVMLTEPGMCASSNCSRCGRRRPSRRRRAPGRPDAARAGAPRRRDRSGPRLSATMSRSWAAAAERGRRARGELVLVVDPRAARSAARS